mmetsp:Transcript_22568/g.47784  ORF Transcript_22568/g.47784 Transcript_22568/m.47784 type:complete len:93 (-) Transcript_22568:478-756(-)
MMTASENETCAKDDTRVTLAKKIAPKIPENKIPTKASIVVMIAIPVHSLAMLKPSGMVAVVAGYTNPYPTVLNVVQERANASTNRVLVSSKS